MKEGIRVRVVSMGAGRCLMMQYTDPISGKRISRSTGTNSRKEAERAAGAWQSELESGRYKSPSKTTWAEFRERYEAEIVVSLAPGSAGKIDAVFNMVERLLSPAKLNVMTTAAIAEYAKKLRAAGRSESTVKSHLGTIRAALRWAERSGLLATLPKFEMPRRTATGRHRAPSLEEFERVLQAVPKVVGDERAESWRHLLNGLWLSGLRISEAMRLSWDNPSLPMVETSGRHVMLSMPAAHQKNHQSQLLPIAPEFGEFLMRTPEEQRSGFVFNPVTLNAGQPRRVAEKRATRIISSIGKEARIKVGSRAGKAGAERLEYFSAHDCRRAFATRWSKRVMPAVLKSLMRHSDIATTMQFYVSQNAQSISDELWAAVEKPTDNTVNNSRDSETTDAKR